MSSASPSSGRPDSEQHGIPHGQALATGDDTATVGGVTIDNGGSFWPISAYRSLVVAINVTGASDVTVTPLWSFLNAAADVANSAEQVAPAGQASRLIFQNQGDTLEGVTFTASANSAFNYYIAGANLDPLPASVAASLDLPWGTRLGDCPTNGQPCNLSTVFDDGPSFYTWDAANKRIVLNEPGQYLVIAGVTYDEGAAGATPANGRLGLTVQVTEVGLSTSWNPWFPLLEEITRVGATDSAGRKWWFVQAVGFVGFDPRMSVVRIKYFGNFSTAATPLATIEWGIVKISGVSATFPP